MKQKVPTAFSSSVPLAHTETWGQDDLAGEMRRLVIQLNVLINEYQTTTARLAQELDASLNTARHELEKSELAFKSLKENLERARSSAIEKANQVLVQGKAYHRKAVEHLRQQSVNTYRFNESDDRGFEIGGVVAKPRKDAVIEAEGQLRYAADFLAQLERIKRPQNQGGMFAAFGILGFVISVCAAANAATGNGGNTFILVNFVSLGLATFIAVARNASTVSDMKSQYRAVESAIAASEPHVAAAVEYAKLEGGRLINSAQESFVGAETQYRDAEKVAKSLYESELLKFKKRFVDEINELKKQFPDFYLKSGFVGRSWADEAWSQWMPANSPALSACIGSLRARPIELIKPYFADVSLEFSIPAIVPFADGMDGKCLLQKATGRVKEECVRATQSIMLRLLANIPPGKVLFTLLDPVGLGQSTAPFMSLADHEEKLITNRAWTEPQHIEEQLTKLTEHMENVIQKYLRNDYSTIEEYNQKAGEVAEPYRVLVVFDFPVNFSETAARRLVSIAKNGPRCGVYTIIVMDTDPSKKLPYGFNLADLENAANVIYHDGRRFVWADKDVERYDVLFDSKPGEILFKHIIKETGTRAPESMRVEVPFDKLLAKAGVNQDSIWKGCTQERIHVPLGPSGAKKLQYLTLGTGTEHHVVCIGMPGSGKSNLMHIIVTTMSLMYSPDEVQLYLVDFKQGVEFKRYAEIALPHARVIAIESEREFGLSVLQGLDEELKQRGEKFRAVGVNVISDYRQKKPEARLPRILLLVDEFQEFFSYDDNIGAQAGLLLDRLVRQGRYAGIHVMLGSQSLANRSSLPSGTLGQIGIRIALKSSESDARLIMGDGNLQARLLSRPGEAIYNSANGLIEGNSFFQVALFGDEDRNKRLDEIKKFAEKVETKAGRAFDSPIVFEGNESARVEECKTLKEILSAEAWPAKTKGVDVWLW